MRTQGRSKNAETIGNTGETGIFLVAIGDCRHGQKWPSPHIVIDAADFGFSGFVR
jgi:hypothetical protein